MEGYCNDTPICSWFARFWKGLFKVICILTLGGIDTTPSNRWKDRTCYFVTLSTAPGLLLDGAMNHKTRLSTAALSSSLSFYPNRDDESETIYDASASYELTLAC
jgi:hypothetical protein